MARFGLPSGRSRLLADPAFRRHVAHGKIRYAVVKAVDGEIAALNASSIEPKILSRSSIPFAHAGRSLRSFFTAFMMTTKRCHFDNFRAKHHVSGRKRRPADLLCRNNFRTLIWCCVGGHVEILRLFADRDRGRRRRWLRQRFVRLYSTLRAFSLISLREWRVLFTRDNRHMWTAGDGVASLSSRLNTLRQKIGDSGKNSAPR